MKQGLMNPHHGKKKEKKKKEHKNDVIGSNSEHRTLKINTLLSKSHSSFLISHVHMDEETDLTSTATIKFSITCSRQCGFPSHSIGSCFYGNFNSGKDQVKDITRLLTTP